MLQLALIKKLGLLAESETVITYVVSKEPYVVSHRWSTSQHR